ncbi:hypothetical protein DL96DRAFT_1713042 [Flagelloscypha sp. PMI_526]|nr:hypothetical protein DL96DRAFT_1713042 [Flagelloscypha sp. PMI_526]
MGRGMNVSVALSFPRVIREQVGCKLLSLGVLDVLLDNLKSRMVYQSLEASTTDRTTLDWIFGSIICIGHAHQAYPPLSQTKMPKRWSTQILRDLPLIFTCTLYICCQSDCLTSANKLSLLGSWCGLHKVIDEFSQVLDNTPGAPEFVAHMWVASLRNAWYLEGGVSNSSALLSSLVPLCPHISSIVVREAGGLHQLSRIIRSCLPQMNNCPPALGLALTAIRDLHKVDSSFALSLTSKRTIAMFSDLIKV